VFEVLRDNHPHVPSHGGRHDMAVLGVIRHGGHERFVSLDERCRKGNRHQFPHPRHGFRRRTPVGRDVAVHLIEDLLAPSRHIHTLLGHREQQVPDTDGVKDAGVQQSRESHKRIGC
jgi:hypothetical protein